MKRLTPFIVVALLAVVPVAVAQPTSDEQRALRSKIEERFDIVPLTDGVALRPKTPIRDVRLIEIADGTILINGVAVTGREVRDRLGAGAEAVISLSYLDAAQRRAVLEARETSRPSETREPATTTEPLERPSRESAEPGSTRRRRATGDRVRIFGNVVVPEGESISGQAVAVMGSVRVDGEVGDQVIAVLGSVDLGPRSVVRGDVVSVGGRVHRQEGAQIRGAVTEVAFAEPNIHLDFVPLFDWRNVWFFDGWGAIPRLIGTTFRFLLLVLLASIALVVARPTVEASAQRVADNPVNATLVGLVAQILVWPVLFITAVVLAISIIGIPLLLLLPFVVLLLLVLALVGYAGVAYAVGQGARRRFGGGTPPAFLDLFLGILVIMLPLFIARLIAIGGWPLTPIVVLLIMTGLGIEFLAWSAGFGAVLTNAFSRWQARRAARQVVVTPPPV